MLETPSYPMSYMIEVNARMHGKKTAIVCEDERATWRDLDDGISRVANGLIEIGLAKGDKVVLMMETSVRMMEMIWGVGRAGGVVVPLNPTLPPEALAFMIGKLGDPLIFADPQLAPLIDGMRSDVTTLPAGHFWIFDEPAPGWKSATALFDQASNSAPDVAIDMSDTLDITFTSGTTGLPKGIELSHLARYNYGIGVGGGLQMSRFSVTICTTPLYTNGCWVLMVPALYWAGTVVLMRKFTPERFLELVEREKCTHLYLLPFQAIAVTTASNADRSNGASALRILSGGAMLPDKTYDRLLSIFPNVAVHLLYGQSEGFTTISGPLDFALGKHGTMGMAVFGADLRLIDRDGNDLGIGAMGEIAFYGPGMMKGYYDDPEATRKLSWEGPQGRTYLKTGDFGRIDEDGYLYFLGRAQDVIICDGQSMFASQIEAIISQHPGVKEVCVVGIPDVRRGEVPVAFVIPQDQSVVGEGELLAWAADRFEGKQGASAIVFRTDFPRGTLDKVNKKALAETYSA